jgi:hypothetical protein
MVPKPHEKEIILQMSGLLSLTINFVNFEKENIEVNA